jgi:hypothetical protein
MCSVWSNQCAQCRALTVLTVEQSMCSVSSNQCAQCRAINVLNVVTIVSPVTVVSLGHSRMLHSLCSLWSSQCAQCRAISVLSVEQSMCSMWSNRCAHYGASSVLTVELSMCSMRSNQRAHCGATNVLTVEQPMCSLWSNQCAHCVAINMHPDLFSIHTTVRQPNQSISNQLDLVVACSKQKSVVHFQRSYVGCCQGCNSAECYGDGTKTFTCYFQVALRLT